MGSRLAPAIIYPYDEAYQVSVKLVPSADSGDGSARVDPAEFTMVILTALDPKDPIVPVVPEMVA